ncbi:MAG: AAA family ATPase [Luteolibacter sp.]
MNNETYDTAGRLESAVGSVVRGQKSTIRSVLACLLAGGHVLLEDVPGTGKTTLSKAISRSIAGLGFKRVQFTPDLLPSDILGVSIFDPRNQDFRFHPGPIFTELLLADEINRASPRTQSALLEAMSEKQVTVEGECRALDGLFFVIATQNPIEFRGTYPLPEAQMDRFFIQCTLGYPDLSDEVEILSDHDQLSPVDRLEPVLSRADVFALMEAAQQVRFSDEMKHYAVRLVAATRGHPLVQLAASPRASLALMKMARAMALFERLDYVPPELIQALAVQVIAHRLQLVPDAKFSGVDARQVVTELLASTPVPV